MKTRSCNKLSEVQQGIHQVHTRSKTPNSILYFGRKSKGSGKSKGNAQKAEPRDLRDPLEMNH